MDRNIFATCGALAIAGLTLSASQTPSPTQPGTAPAQPAASGTTVTVTGCLKPWTGAASSTAATSGAAAATAQYMLTDVEDKHMSGGSTASGTTPAKPGTPSTSGSTGAASRGEGAMDKDDYLLRADSAAVNFSQHVNHKVEVTGRKMAKDARGSSMGTTTPGTPGTTGTPGSTGTTATSGTTASSGTTGREHAAGKPDMPTLTVTSLKMVSATCP